MVKEWVQILLYVTVNAPIPTHRELWRSQSAGNAGASVVRLQRQAQPPESPLQLDSRGWARQHLTPFFDLAESHSFGAFWTDLKKPADPGAKVPSAAPIVNAVRTAPAVKQHLVPAPREPRHERNLHPYRFSFSGQVTVEGRPSRQATVVLRLATPKADVIRKALSDQNGRYQITERLEGLDNENVLWWLHAENGHGRSPELEGSRILSHEQPVNNLERDLVVSAP